MNTIVRVAVVSSWLISGAFAGDFNGDGFDDLAIGSYGEDAGGLNNTGFVHIVYGSSNGPDDQNVDFLFEGSVAFPGQQSSRFGAALASGDFDGDGFAELAIGAPDASVSGLSAAGVVYVVAGSATGLDTAKVQTWSQNAPGIKDKVEKHPYYLAGSIERFGRELATGDFDGDGFDDLAITVDEGSKKAMSAGGVHVLYGSPTGLRAKRNQLWTLDSKGVPGKSVEGSVFGEALAVGDFDGDGFDDLCIASHAKFDTDTWDALLVLRGGKKGITTKKRAWFAPDGDGLDDNGFASEAIILAAGDLDGNGFDDLAVGLPYQEVASNHWAGEFRLFEGAATGLDTTNETTYSRATFGVEGGVDADEVFGATLAIADLDDDGFEDLVVGAPGSLVSGTTPAGDIQVFRGKGGGGLISTADDEIWSRASSGIADTPEIGDRFGDALAVADYDGDGFFDVCVGVPWDDVSGIPDAGAAHVLPGSGTGITSTGSLLLNQNTLGSSAEATDLFGASAR